MPEGLLHHRPAAASVMPIYAPLPPPGRKQARAGSSFIVRAAAARSGGGDSAHNPPPPPVSTHPPPPSITPPPPTPLGLPQSAPNFKPEQCPQLRKDLADYLVTLQASSRQAAAGQLLASCGGSQPRHGMLQPQQRPLPPSFPPHLHDLIANVHCWGPGKAETLSSTPALHARGCCARRKGGMDLAWGAEQALAPIHPTTKHTPVLAAGGARRC